MTLYESCCVQLKQTCSFHCIPRGGTVASLMLCPSVLEVMAFECLAVWGRTSQNVCLKRPPQWHNNGKSMLLGLWANKSAVGWWTLSLSPGQLGRIRNVPAPAEIDGGFVWNTEKVQWTMTARLCANKGKWRVKSLAISWGNNDPYEFSRCGRFT